MGRRQLVLAMLSMLSLYFFSFFLRTAVPGTIFNELQSDLHMSATAVTGLGSGFLYIYAGMQLVVGLAADRFGGTRTLLVGGFIMAVGAAWFPTCQSQSSLYASRALTGFGASFMYLCIIKELDLLFGHRRFPVMLGVSLFIGYSGGIFAMLPFERIVASWGWRTSLLGVAAGIFTAWGAACWALRGLDHFTPPATGFSLSPLWRVVRNRPSWALLLVSLINYPSYFVMQAAIGKKFLQDYAGLTSAHSATFTTIMMFISASLMLLAGPLLRLTGQRRKPHLYAAGVLLLAANLMLLAGVLINATSWWFLAAYGLLAASTASAPAGNATMKELNAADAVGAAIAVYNGLAYVGVAILVNASGLILDAFRHQAVTVGDAIQYPPAAYATFFGALVVLSLVSLVLLVFVPEGASRDEIVARP